MSRNSADAGSRRPEQGVSTRSSGARIKILFVITQMEIGGAQKVLLAVAHGLPHQKYDVSVCTLYDKANWVEVVTRETGLQILDLGMKKPGERNPVAILWRLLRGYWRLYLYLKRKHVDVVQTFTHYSNIIVPPAARLAGIPIVVTSERASLVHLNKAVRIASRLVSNSRWVTHVVCVSDAMRRECTRGVRNPAKFSTILNGVETERFAANLNEQERSAIRAELGVAGRRHVVTTVGKLHPQKGHRYLIEAVPRILAQFPETVVLIAGEGALRSQIEEQIAQAGLNDAVRLIGVRRDVARIYAISDLFVLASLWEGMPNVVLEAMAAGLPVVATDVDGTREAVLDRQTGLLVPPADAAALARAICALLGDANVRARMGAAGRERVHNQFGLDDTVRRFEQLYDSLGAHVVGS
jgi:glycosyltransferase involved in cell wall biosynthesis